MRLDALWKTVWNLVAVFSNDSCSSHTGSHGDSKGLQDGWEWREQPSRLDLHMQSWKALCMRKIGHEMKGKKVVWASQETPVIWHNPNRGI